MTVINHQTKLEKTVDGLQNQEAVLFIGAGTSMNPPAGLSNWHNLRDWTLEAVANRATRLRSLAPKLMAIDMLGSPGRKGITPELVASVISGSCPEYFTCLKVLDDGTSNENHLAIAWLAKLSLVHYIVTTNFDLFLEKASEQPCSGLAHHNFLWSLISVLSEPGSFISK